jgi:hypothetical protein
MSNSDSRIITYKTPNTINTGNNSITLLSNASVAESPDSIYSEELRGFKAGEGSSAVVKQKCESFIKSFCITTKQQEFKRTHKNFIDQGIASFGPNVKQVSRILLIV